MNLEQLPANDMDLIEMKNLSRPTTDSVQTNEEKFTVFKLSVKNGKTAYVKQIIKKGVDLSLKDANGDSHLHLLVKIGKLKLIELLFENSQASSYINETNDSKQTPLHLAVIHNYFEIARYLLGKGARADTEDEQQKCPLSDAIDRKYESLAKLLIRNREAVVHYENSGKSVLFACCATGNLELVNYCVSRGANILETRNGYNALHHGVRTHNHKLIRRLLDWKVDVNQATNDDKTTPLHRMFVVEGRQNPFRIHATMMLLLGRNANFNAVDNRNRSVLYYAIENDQWRSALYLVKKHAEIDINVKCLVIDRAIRREDAFVVKHLLGRGPKLHRDDKLCFLQRVLIYSKDCKLNFDMVKPFMESGMNVSKQCRKLLDDEEFEELRSYEKELDRMKKTRVPGATYHDLLVEHEERFIDLRCYGSDAVMRSKEHRKLFPNFSDRLESNYALGVRRSMVMDEPCMYMPEYLCRRLNKSPSELNMISEMHNVFNRWEMRDFLKDYLYRL